MAEAQERLRQIEERTKEAERRAAEAERLAKLKSEEDERERRLQEIRDSVAQAEERAREAERRATEAEQAVIQSVQAGPGQASPPPPPPQAALSRSHRLPILAPRCRSPSRRLRRPHQPHRLHRSHHHPRRCRRPRLRRPSRRPRLPRRPQSRLLRPLGRLTSTRSPSSSFVPKTFQSLRPHVCSPTASGWDASAPSTSSTRYRVSPKTLSKT